MGAHSAALRNYSSTWNINRTRRNCSSRHVLESNFGIQEAAGTTQHAIWTRESIRFPKSILQHTNVNSSFWFAQDGSFLNYTILDKEVAFDTRLMNTNTSSKRNLPAIAGGLMGAVANGLLFIPEIAIIGLFAGGVGLVLSFLGLGIAKKATEPDMKLVIPGFILNLLAIGLGIYFQYFIVGDTAPPDPDLLFLDSM